MRHCIGLVALSFIFLVSLSGCIEQELEITVNEDGSGTMEGTITFSDRMIVLIHEMDGMMEGLSGMMSSVMSSAMGGGPSGTAAEPMTAEDFTELMQSEMLLQLAVPEGIELQEAEATPREGGLHYEIAGTFDDLSVFAPKDDTESASASTEGEGEGAQVSGDFLGLQILEDDRGKGLVRLVLLGEEKKEGAPGAMNFDGMMSGMMYFMLKGFKKDITIHLPVAATSETAEISNDGKTLRWAVDLTSVAKYYESKKLLTTDGASTAAFPLDDLEWQLHKAELILSGSDEDIPSGSEEDTFPGLETTQSDGPATAKAEIDEVVLTHVVSLDGEKPIEIEPPKFGVKLFAPEKTPIVKVGEPELLSALDDKGNDLTDLGNFFYGGGNTTESVIVYCAAPSLEATEIRNIEGRLPVVLATGAERFVIPMEDFAARVEQGTLGIEALDAAGLRVEVGNFNGPSFDFKVEKDDELPSPIKSVEFVLAGENDEHALSTSGEFQWGKQFYTPNPATTIEEIVESHKEVVIELNTEFTEETLTFAAETIPLP